MERKSIVESIKPILEEYMNCTKETKIDNFDQSVEYAKVFKAIIESLGLNGREISNLLGAHFYYHGYIGLRDLDPKVIKVNIDLKSISEKTGQSESEIMNRIKEIFKGLEEESNINYQKTLEHQ